jgi:hypothetical protein
MADVEFQAFRIAGIAGPPLFPNSGPEAVRLLMAAGASGRWFDANAMRYGLVRCERIATAVMTGALAQQHELSQQSYTDDKRSEVVALASFADRQFALDATRGILFLEWRSFVGQPPLSSSRYKERWEMLLAAVWAELANTTRLSLRKVDETTPKEEMISLFYSNRISALKVRRFAADAVPVDITLVNPSPGLENALREILEHDESYVAFGDVEMSTKRGSESNLNRSAFARAALHSGDPTMIEYVDDHGQRRRRRSIETGRAKAKFEPADETTQARAAAWRATAETLVSHIDLRAPRVRRELPTGDSLELFESDEG